MKQTVFEYGDYKQYLRDFFRSKPSKGHGLKSALAAAIRSHSAYVSVVLKGNSHLTLEQAAASNQFLNHNDAESHFFILLVEGARAGTPLLREYFKKQVEKIQADRLLLKNRLDFEGSLDSLQQSIYYSSWIYAAIHMATLTHGGLGVRGMAEYLGVESEIFIKKLQFLEKAGLIEKIGKDRYQVSKKTVHLGQDSPMIAKHHANWRMRAIHALDQSDPSALHYSSVVSLSKKDVAVVKRSLIQALEVVRQTVRDSGDEKVYCYNIDWFSVGRPEVRN